MCLVTSKLQQLNKLVIEERPKTGTATVTRQGTGTSGKCNGKAFVDKEARLREFEAYKQ